MSTARHARPRAVAVDPVGPLPRNRHRAPARPAPLHPAVVGAAAAAMAVGGVAVVRFDSQGTVDTSVSAAAETGRLLAGSARPADSAAVARSSTRAPLTVAADPAPAAGTGRHRKADPVVTAAEPDGPPALRRACGYTASTQRTHDLNRTQLRNARTIVEVSQKRGLPPRAAVIALATARQESELLNMAGGDRDSRGLFQQRPSMGWGTPGQVRTPEYAANAFYAALTDVDGWRRLPLTVAAQRVQRSAFGWAYARWELLAATVVDDLLDVPDEALNCTRGD